MDEKVKDEDEFSLVDMKLEIKVSNEITAYSFDSHIYGSIDCPDVLLLGKSERQFIAI